MKTLNGKEFIKTFLIDGLSKMINDYPYFSFIIMGIGIEFLGKCVNEKRKNWTKRGKSEKDFKKAINDIPSLQKYSCYLDEDTYDLYGSFRCGLAHSIAPNYIITLSSKDELPHLEVKGGRVNFKVEDFFNDFKEACNFVLGLSDDPENKINQPFLEIPEKTFGIVDISKLSATGSIFSATSIK